MKQAEEPGKPRLEKILLEVKIGNLLIDAGLVDEAIYYYDNAIAISLSNHSLTTEEQAALNSESERLGDKIDDFIVDQGE